MTDLLDVASAVLPGQSLHGAFVAHGGSHSAVVIPDVAVVRIARKPTAVSLLPRRTELLRRLNSMDLPFAVPVPLTEVVEVDGHTVVVLSWLPGSGLPRGTAVDPAELVRLLDALRGIDLALLDGLLGEPHEYAGGSRWPSLMLDEVVPRLPADVRSDARRRIEDALTLPAVTPSLVHNDLAGDNMHWSADHRLVGVLDWDLAQPFDPATDAACLAWYGWETVASAVPADTLRRAHTWYRTFGLEQVAFAVLNGEPEDSVAQRCATAAAWLRRTAKFPSPS
ncbi:aminoglycoside phosphotransferase family protein [Kutzneria sp. NPDC051319]|uniref:phosphotransferase family protein n=1 Tax=Kutzneria sp. NPDC051319 TaxID=3155047 RepID=UPI00342482FF